MIPNVEELRAKLQANLFVNGEHLEDGEIPVLESGPANDVASRIAKGEEDGIVHKGAGVEDRSRDAGFPVLIAYEVRPHFIKSNTSATIAGGDIGQGIGNREPIASLRGYDAGDLPVSDDLIEHAGRASTKLFSVAEGKLVDVAEYEAMAHIEVGVAYSR